jgi:hypothetical protein
MRFTDAQIKVIEKMNGFTAHESVGNAGYILDNTERSDRWIPRMTMLALKKKGVVAIQDGVAVLIGNPLY